MLGIFVQVHYFIRACKYSLTVLLSRLSRVRLCATPNTAVHRHPGGSPVPGILQARTLEWVAISFSNTWKWKVKVKLLSHVWLLATPWLQPTRLLRPWDFPGKSNGVDCHLNYVTESIQMRSDITKRWLEIKYLRSTCIKRRLKNIAGNRNILPKKSNHH